MYKWNIIWFQKFSAHKRIRYERMFSPDSTRAFREKKNQLKKQQDVTKLENTPVPWTRRNKFPVAVPWKFPFANSWCRFPRRPLEYTIVQPIDVPLYLVEI